MYYCKDICIICNALYNRRLTLIAMIKLNSVQTEIN